MVIPKLHIKPQAGISLVGVLVAAFILAVGAIAITRLTSSAEKFTGVGREVTIASSLAREGLELARAVRDNNWFQENTDSTHWLDHGICVEGTSDSTDSNRQVIIDPVIVQAISQASDTNRNLTSGNPQLYINEDGTWAHDGTKASPYKRVIAINCSTKNDEPTFITVTSTVTWSSRGQNREVVLKERLYNWLPDRANTNSANP
ncbi:MAG: hypothetical protein HYZ63_03660 [Candidatus Andersenbacteria bacterium]|nr:hypothetical protein [Candidatus Andersenbacteria bacterium]